MNPAYQRDYIAGENRPWQRKLIQNLMRGEVVLPALYVRVNNKFQIMKSYDPDNLTPEQRDLIIQNIIEMIDGQQRSRTIYDFRDDVFSLGNMTITHVDDYNDVVQTDLDNPVASDMMNDFELNVHYSKFLDKKITVVCTLGSDTEVHQMFIDLNDLNNMKDQEKRNATNTLIAKWIRDNARLDCHDLFKRDDELKGEYLNFSMKRMNQDEVLAKCFALTDGIAFAKGIGKVTLDKLYRMTSYSSKTKDMVRISGRVSKVLDKILVILKDGTYFKSTKKENTFVNLYMVVHSLLFDANVKVTDWKKVGDWFFETHNDLCDITNPNNLMSGPDLTIFGRKNMYNDREALIVRLTSLKRAGMYSNKGVVLVDPLRVISDDEFESVWFSYGKKCAGCEVDLKLHEAIKGHIVAHSKGIEKGGVTTVENTVPLCKCCNKPQVEDQKVSVAV